jgi:excinuclease ABC subunit B
VSETNRRRELQLKYNAEHGITPQTVKSAIKSVIEEEVQAHQLAQEVAGKGGEDYVTEEFLEALQKEMLEAAQNLEFERAALLRDKIATLKGEKVATPQGRKARGRGRKPPVGG